MLWMLQVMMTTLKTLLTFTRRIAAMGLFGCATIALIPGGCGGVEQAAPPAHASSNRSRLSRITEERLSGCLNEYADQVEEGTLSVKATVQVNEETGQIIDVVLDGVPQSAGDFAACTRVTLRDMAIPPGVLNQRHGQDVGSTNGQTVPRGNELANPFVVWELGAAIAEFMAENGGRVVLYTVAIEALAATAVVAVTAAVSKRQKNRCRDQYVECVASSYWKKHGRHEWDSQCSLCAGECYATGKWPSMVGIKDCNY